MEGSSYRVVDLEEADSCGGFAAAMIEISQHTAVGQYCSHGSSSHAPDCISIRSLNYIPSSSCKLRKVMQLRIRDSITLVRYQEFLKP